MAFARSRFDFVTLNPQPLPPRYWGTTNWQPLPPIW